MSSEKSAPLDQEAAGKDFVDSDLLGELTLVIDTESEEIARGAFSRFCDAAALVGSRRQTWSPYTKLGSHSLISAPFLLSERGKDQVCAAIDATCDRVATGSKGDGSNADRGVISIGYRSGDYSYERILDGRIHSFKVPRVLWAHFWIQSDEDFQNNMRERFE